MKRFLTALLSSILFATIYSWIFYVPNSQREPNVYYFGFIETFVIVIIYAGPVYILAGLPLSIIIDKLVVNRTRNSKWLRYFVQLGLYSMAGILVAIIYLTMPFQNLNPEGIIIASIYGFAASNLYFHLLLLISKMRGITL